MDGKQRHWDPYHSKLAAYLLCGGKYWPFKASSRILYLGAAQGQTLSHISDICHQGSLFGVESSLIPYHKLHQLGQVRVNLLPLLGDARRPETYQHIVERVDLLYQDVAAKEQFDIFLDNARKFTGDGGWGILMVKPRSVDVTRPPKEVVEEMANRLKKEHRLLEQRSLHRYSREHSCLVVRFDQKSFKNNGQGDP